LVIDPLMKNKETNKKWGSRMPTWLYILISMAVAAFVGGLTNHFAIKMLFHPRKPIYIGSWRVPFTPGLIPKRKEEIAGSLGEIVSDYLVTTEGLQELLQKPHFRAQIENRLIEGIQWLGQDERTLKEFALGYMSEEAWEAYKDRTVLWLQGAVDQGIKWAWNRYELADKPLHELIPGWSPELMTRWSDMAAEGIMSAVREEITSLQGQRMLRRVASGLVSQSGGFLGAMASMFMDEEKIVQKMTPVLVEQLESEHVRVILSTKIERKLESLSTLPLDQVLRSMAGEDGLNWISRHARNMLQWKQWVQQAEEIHIGSLVSRFEERLTLVMPRVVQVALGMLERNMANIVKSIQLPQLVREQVERFPIERLEQIILSVSGREFQAITWLGALLGGIIGLFQALFMLWLG